MLEINRRACLTGIISVLTPAILLSETKFISTCFAQKGAGREKKRHDFSSLRPLMESFIQEHKIAGASMTVAHHGEVVLSHGFGLAVHAPRKPVTNETLFSIASITKAITGVATLKLIEDGKLGLDDYVMKILADLGGARGGKPADQRFRKITVHHLLYHGAGFPNDVKIPAEKSSNRQNEEDDDDAADHADLLYQELLKLPLQFDPGTQHKYSNNGFIVLRLVIEHASGQSYETYCREKILAPMGIHGMHLEQPGDYEPHETHRFRPGGEKETSRNVANWLSTSAELVQFASSVAGSGRTHFLTASTCGRMLEFPAELKGPPREKGPHVGLGWDSAEKFADGSFYFAKNGGKPGVQAWLEHLPSGIDWALFFNTSPPKDGPNPMTQARKLVKSKFEEIVG